MRWRRNFHYLAVKAKCFRNNLNLFFFFEWVKIPGKEIMFLELKEIKKTSCFQCPVIRSTVTSYICLAVGISEFKSSNASIARGQLILV